MEYHSATRKNRIFPFAAPLTEPTGKESTCNAGDPGFIPGLGRSLGEEIGSPLQYFWVSLVVQTVKNLPAMQETWIQSLSWKDPLEELGNPLQYSCLADSMDRGAWRATVHRVARVGHD